MGGFLTFSAAVPAPAPALLLTTRYLGIVRENEREKNTSNKKEARMANVICTPIKVRGKNRRRRTLSERNNKRIFAIFLSFCLFLSFI